VELLSASPNDLDVLHPELVDDFAEKRPPSQEWLDQTDLEVGTRQRQDDSGQAGSASDIGHGAAPWDGPRNHGAVQHMA
jgi:hypothetical protein